MNGRLFWISLTGLFVEIMLIRWMGTEVRVFAYFQNLALIACFLGFGLGCYWLGRYKSYLQLLGIAGLGYSGGGDAGACWQVFMSGLSTRLSLSPDAAMWGYLPRNRSRDGTCCLRHLSLALRLSCSCWWRS